MQSQGLVVSDMSVDRGGRTLLADLSFTVAPGTALAVAGQNGVGKSTLLRAIAGLLPAAKGRATLHLGRDSRAISPHDPHAEEPAQPASRSTHQRRASFDTPPAAAAQDEGGGEAPPGDDGGSLGERAHYLGHANGLKAGLSAAANLLFRQRWGGNPGHTPADALAAVGLAHCAEIPVAFLSAGQKRRVALAGLLVSRRPLWLLDEPAAALDQSSEVVLVDLLRAHLAGGGIAVMALHAPLALPMATLRLGRA